MNILITGATSGIGRLTAQALAERGHSLLLHGRSQTKLDTVAEAIGGDTATFAADLSSREEVERLASAVCARDDALDVLINNAGVLKTATPRMADGSDVRFQVNTVSPYLLFRRIEPCLAASGRIVNLSSAAQHPVDLDALRGGRALTDFDAYAQSKLALTMWSCEVGRTLASDGPMVVAVNPGSMLGTKMVKEGFGSSGRDVAIGVDIVVRAATAPEFADAHGAYFDNDRGAFGQPHRDALDRAACQRLIAILDELIEPDEAA